MWVRPWLAEILKLPNCSALLTVKLFVTRELIQQRHLPSPDISNSETVISYFYKRPDIMKLLQEEVENQIGAMFVMVCGPGGLSDDARAAVRQCQRSGHEVCFEENCFSWWWRIRGLF
ncbi:uncharacterized protein GLRG_08014 [Colletotrichum graminicola M1.001]|uniref:Ferric reductase NAD binding domain-containing protein n=1 Tax=Colletotrichum graminicola (strain M1.001 / M2 / FGSC 10212) TaxID=645133 RepID=E3QPU3_COLGM|nr:uncharacterized protein GLRG_08014 [Colletotrichum graminicola M1.001]EFQ32870.1 hypothetical protein GLRG_08014 [Colletotrichum graminicola M1.001]